MFLCPVICTRNRPLPLKHCLASLLSQTRAADEILLVDSSDPGPKEKVRGLVKELAANPKNPPVRLVDSEPGLTLQRNLGVKNLSPDCGLVLFFDDDSIVMPEHLERMERYAAENPEVAGFSGITFSLHDLKPFRLGQLARAFFLMSHNLARRPGLLPSFNPAFSLALKKPVRAEILCGNAAFRKFVFNEFSFDQRLSGYALFEDVDFSYSVSRKHPLLALPDCPVFHNHADNGRPDLYRMERMWAVNRIYLFKKHLNKNLWQRACFAWASLGQILYAGLTSLRRRDPAPLKGCLDGLFPRRRAIRDDNG